MLCFLTAVEKVRPEVVTSLRDEVLPKVSTWATPAPPEPWDPAEVLKGCPLLGPPWKVEERLTEDLLTWAQRFHLDRWEKHGQSFFSELMSFTLGCWCCYGRLDPEAPEVSRVLVAPLNYLGIHTWGELILAARESVLHGQWSGLLSRRWQPQRRADHQLATWRQLCQEDGMPSYARPQLERIKECLALLDGGAPTYDPLKMSRAEWEAVCAAYADRVDAAFKQAGFPHGSLKTAMQHFEWTARYQVGEESYQKIAKSVAPWAPLPRQLERVKKAVQRTADLLTLVLLPAPRGRPPKRRHRKIGPMS